MLERDEGSYIPGMCVSCKWSRKVLTGKGSLFWQCRRHDLEPLYAKYPRIPVFWCKGYEPGQEAQADPTEAGV